MSSQEWVTIIGAISLALVNVITAWRSSVAKGRIAGQTNSKLDAIHESTNSNLVAVNAELIAANDRIAKLESMLAAQASALARE
jgi:hypothetical protein